MNALTKVTENQVDFEIRSIAIDENILNRTSGNKLTRRNIELSGIKFNQFLHDTGLVFSRFALTEYLKKLKSERIRNKERKDSAIKTHLHQIKSILLAQDVAINNYFIKHAILDIFETFFKKDFDITVDKKIEENKYLTADEIQKMIKHARTKKDKLMIAFLAETGMRINEMTNIKISGLRYENNQYNYTFAGKKKIIRTVALKKEFIDTIINEFNSHEYLFETKNHKPFLNCSVYRTMRLAGVRAGLAKTVGCHTFRHSFATLLHQKGESVNMIAECLGHTTTKTTQDMYIHTNHLSKMATLFDYSSNI